MVQPNNAAIGRMIIAASVIAAVADSDPDGKVRFRTALGTPITNIVVSDLPEREQKLVERHCGPEFGLPQKTPENAGHLGPTTVIIRETYVLEHGAETRTPYWVCESITSQDLSGPDTTRLKPEPFGPEPWVDRGSRAELKDYRRSGYARGHMMPDADRTKNKLKAETYFLSNMVPQWGPFNSGTWLRLEKQVRTWAVARKRIHVITGPLWYDPTEEDPTKADGQVKFFVIGENQVAVPTHLFKIVLSGSVDEDNLEVLAFVLENKAKYPSKPPLRDYLTSVDWIEKHSGFDFFATLDDPLEDRLEAGIAQDIWPSSADDSE